MTAQIIPVPVFDLVVFGATGDLAYRKLLPALYWRERDQQMPPGSRIVAVARSELSTEAYVGAGRGCLPRARRGRVRAGSVRAAGLPANLRPARRRAVGGLGRLGGCPRRRRGAAAPVLSRHLARPVRAGLRRCGCRRHRHAQGPRRAGKADRPRSRLRDPDQRRGRCGFRRVADLPDRPLSREGVGPEPAGTTLRQLAVRAGLEPGLHRPRPDHRRRDRRRRGARGLLRPLGRLCATWSRTTCCSSCASSAWSRPCRSPPIRCATRS